MPCSKFCDTEYVMQKYRQKPIKSYEAVTSCTCFSVRRVTVTSAAARSSTASGSYRPRIVQTHSECTFIAFIASCQTQQTLNTPQSVFVSLCGRENITYMYFIVVYVLFLFQHVCAGGVIRS